MNHSIQKAALTSMQALKKYPEMHPICKSI